MSDKTPIPAFSPPQAALAALSVAHRISRADADALGDFIATQAAFAALDNIAQAQEMAQVARPRHKRCDRRFRYIAQSIGRRLAR